MTKTLEQYCREAMSEKYTDYTADPAALPAYQELQKMGFGEVVHDGPAWRFMISPSNSLAARDWLRAVAI